MIARRGFGLVSLLAGQIRFAEIVSGAQTLVNEIVETDPAAANLGDDGLPEMLAEDPAEPAIETAVVMFIFGPVGSKAAITQPVKYTKLS